MQVKQLVIFKHVEHPFKQGVQVPESR